MEKKGEGERKLKKEQFYAGMVRLGTGPRYPTGQRPGRPIGRVWLSVKGGFSAAASE